MSAQQTGRGTVSVDDDRVPVAAGSAVLHIACPGKAHKTGGECLICDEGAGGMISVVITEVELVALGCAAQGRPVDSRFSPRLHALGLLHDIAGCPVPTERGYALLGGPLLRPD
jgi:hypothetical protein